jgi:RHS repeat-associated protein
VLDNAISRKTVTYQDVFENNSNPVTESWSYGITRFGSTVIGPDGGITSQTHYDTASGLPNAGLVSFEQYANGETVERTWQNNQPSTTTAFMTNQYANFYIKREFRSIPNAAGTAMVWTAIKDYDYDKNGNVTRVAQYDWVPYDSVHANGAAFLPGNLIPTRLTTTAYYNATLSAENYTTEQPNAYWNPAASNIRGLAAATEVQGRVGQSLIVVARSEFVYDNPGTTGNPTRVTNWDSSKGPLNSSAPVLTSGNSISVLTEYNQYGGPTLITDARGFLTHLTYGNAGGYIDLYPTVTQAAYGTAVQRTETRDYDPSSGLVKRTTDNDNNVSSSTVYDAFGRPTLVTAAEGTAAEARSSTEYSDGERRVIVRSDLNNAGDGRLVAIQHYDQLGRVRLTQQLEDAATENAYLESSGIKVQTRYLVAGSNNYQLVSNPYRASSVNAAGSEATMGWTRTSSDNAGRFVEVQAFGGAGLPAPWGSNTSSSGAAVTAVDANTVVVTDQSGRQRKSVTDGLGRLIQVYEDPAGVNYLTSYSYDARDDLVGVNQGSQSRTFVYDSLKRLTAATNPESGTINYDYDENGNLRHRTDARLLADNSDHVRITYDYDELNRVKTRIYNDGTPNVTYSYDPGIANGKGRLASVSSTVSSYSYEEFDALGRIKAGKQTTDGNVYAMSYMYDLAGHLTSQVYPSGRVVTNSFDTAGRLNNVTGQKTGQAARTYASSFSYTAHGAVATAQLGNGLWEHAGFNSRLQSTQIGLGTAGTNSSVLELDYNYGTTNNNGNVQSQSITVPGAAALTQSYSYDQLNRLLSAQETSGGNPSWQQAFTYLDQNGQNGRYGNRRIDAANTTTELISENPWFDPATNRIQPQAGEQYDYDAAGNLRKDKTGHTFAYDAENKQTIYAGGNPANGGASYAYDGNGQRVKKVGSAGTTISVYDAMGKLVAEYSDPQPSTGGGTSYVTADNLGTPRVITNATGNVIGRHDYLPFGEEIASTYGGRSGVSGYAATDNVKQKFTSNERDLETGLDYVQARYYSAVQGRFISSDPMMSSGRTSEPQTWNRYTYCGNNPLIYIDPTGTDWYIRDGEGYPEWYDADPGSGYTKYNERVYYGGKEFGWVRLSEYNSNWTTYSTKEAADRSKYGNRTDYAPVLDQWALHMAESPFLGVFLFTFGAGPALDIAGGESLPTEATTETLAVDEAAANTSVRVGRWMSPEEFTLMSDTGVVQESRLGGVTNVTYPANASAYLNARVGSLFAEFNVPSSAVRARSGIWAKIYGPHSIFGPKLGIEEMPKASQITHTATKIK